MKESFGTPQEDPRRNRCTSGIHSWSSSLPFHSLKIKLEGAEIRQFQKRFEEATMINYLKYLGRSQREFTSSLFTR